MHGRVSRINLPVLRSLAESGEITVITGRAAAARAARHRGAHQPSRPHVPPAPDPSADASPASPIGRTAGVELPPADPDHSGTLHTCLGSWPAVCALP